MITTIMNRLKLNIHKIIMYVTNLLGYEQVTLSNSVYNIANYKQGECDRLLTKNNVDLIVRNIILVSVKDSILYNSGVQEYGSNTTTGEHPFSNNDKLLIAVGKPCKQYLIGEFAGCTSLLAVGRLDTSNVLSINKMFEDCISLREIDFSAFDISKITNLVSAFCRCKSLKSIDFSHGYIYANSLQFTFDGCSHLECVRFSNKKLTQPINLQGVFRSCNKLLDVDVSIFDKITNLYTAFEYCSSLSQLDVSNWDVSTCGNFNRAFEGCSSLTQLDVSNWDVSNATVFDNLFASCPSLTQLDVSNWDVSNVTSFSGVFASCSSLTQLDVSNWDVSSATSLSRFFNGCSSLTQLDVSNWDVSNATDFNSMFKGVKCEFDISKWNMSKATNISMFAHSSLISRFDYPNISIGRNANMAQMFYSCSNLEYIDISNWDIQDTTIASLTRSSANIITFHMCDFSHNIQLDDYSIASPKLVTLTINGQTTRESFTLANCGLLSDESIINVANALYDLSAEIESDSFESPTLKLHKDVYRRAENIMIDELDLPTWATLKGWTLIN